MNKVEFKLGLNTDEDDINLLINEAKKNKINVYPVFQNRYNLAVKRLRKAIRQEELGKIRVVNVRVRWCRPQRYYDLSVWRK